MLGITWSAANFSLQVAIKSKIEQDFKKSKTKSPKELHHVFDKVTHPCPAFAGVRELGSYVVGPIYPLACTERAFDFISFWDSLGHLCNELRCLRLFRWSSERLAIWLYLFIFQVRPVCFVQIDLVRVDGCREKAKPVLEFLRMKFQVSLN